LVENPRAIEAAQVPITEIGRSHVAQVHNGLAKTPYQANRLLAVLRKFFNWCEKNGFARIIPILLARRTVQGAQA
jgi:site-specific recombinase XerD